MDKRYQFFISSTFEDLKEEREQVMRAILALNYFPAGMELFPATDNKQLDYIKSVIDQCDYYILIIGARYGSIDKDGVSYTEKEYEYAKRKKIPIIAFLHNDIESIPLGKTDQKKALFKKVIEFRDKVKKGRLVSFWNSPSDLKDKVSSSITKAIGLRERQGWVRGDDILPKEALERAQKLEASVKRMKLSQSDLVIRPFSIQTIVFNMVFVKGGTFVMGATSEQLKDAEKNEHPAHLKTVEDYWIGETPVTQELWEAVTGVNPSRFTVSHGYEYLPNRPVEQITWRDCEDFIKKLNEQLKHQLMDFPGMEFQLPTEAQWEFAARGGNIGKRNSQDRLSGGDDPEAVAWYASNSKEETHPVKTKRHNELGIYDMSGNVWEWCQDEYKLYDNKENNLTQPNNNDSKRVGRGGCWHSERKHCRVSYRDKANMTHAGNGLGMRLVLSAKRK